MIYELTEIEYVQMRLARCTQRKEIFALFPAAFQAVARGQLSKLSGTELAILISLMSVTIASGRLARDLSIRELAEGIKDEEKNYITGGTGLSENGIRSALKTMSNSGLLRIYKESKSAGHDNSPRVYEIDFNSLDPGLARKIDSIPPAKFEGGPLTVCRGLYISNYVTTTTENKATSSLILAGSEVTRENKQEGTEMAYVGKKPVKRFETAQEAIASVLGKSKAVAAERVGSGTAKAPHLITRVEMQAIFDKVREECSLPYRLMVTVREHGYLKKRLQANPPEDFFAFVRYCVTYWGVISAQNRKAVANQDHAKGTVKKTLPEAPHFSTFTYWYPYFFRVYQNHLAGKSVPQKESNHEATVRKMHAQIEVPLNEIRRRREVLPVRTVVAPRRPEVVRRAPAVSLDADVSFPDWDSRKN